MSKLNQVLAVEKGIKSKVTSELSEAYKLLQKPALFEGLVKTYQPLNEEGTKFPSESKRVQYNALELVKLWANRNSEYLDVTATKDYANCGALASVMVDGQVLIQDAPVTFLLALEKELVGLYTFIETLPVLALETEWVSDGNGAWKSELFVTVKTEKVQDKLVLIEPTKEHPGQAQLITKDVVVGNWTQQKLSGAIQSGKKKELLEKVVKLQHAVKFAREQGNMADAPRKQVSEKLYNWLLG